MLPNLQSRGYARVESLSGAGLIHRAAECLTQRDLPEEIRLRIAGALLCRATRFADEWPRDLAIKSEHLAASLQTYGAVSQTVSLMSDTEIAKAIDQLKDFFGAFDQQCFGCGRQAGAAF